MGGTEPEFTQNSSGKPAISIEGGAQSGAQGKSQSAASTEAPDFVQLRAFWIKLSPAGREAIIALAGATAVQVKE